MSYKILITAILTMLSFCCLAGPGGGHGGGPGGGRGEGKQYEGKANREHEGKREEKSTERGVKRNKHKRNPMAATPAIPGHKGKPATPAVPGNPKARENVIENR